MKTIELIAYMQNLGFTNKQSIYFIENELQKEKVNTESFHIETLPDNIYNSIKDKILELFKNEVDDINFIKQLDNNIYDEEILDIIELSQAVNRFESLGDSGRYLNCTWFDIGLTDGSSVNVYWNRE